MTLPWSVPRRLWGLDEMINYLTFNTAIAIEQLYRGIDRSFNFHGFEQLPNHEKQSLRTGCVKFVAEEIERLGLSFELKLKVMHLTSELSDNNFVAPQAMTRALELLKQDFVSELVKRKFAYIPPPNDQYFEKAALFGEQVNTVIPEAAQDIKDAGNCIAASLDTAAVFHLMRVAEHGLRAIAKKLRVRVTHKGRLCPLELADWQQVITGIKNKIDPVRQMPHGSTKKKARLEMYSEAADHCTFMKDVVRNNVSHTRKPYKQSEAIAILEQVKDFTQFVARIL